MRRLIFTALVITLLSGCGHSSINYTPRSGMAWDQAVAIVERGFHEDFGDERAQSVVVTDTAIILADGNITTGSFAGTAVPVYGSAVMVGSSNSRTVAAGQHIYLDSLMPAIVMKKNGRDDRYAVIIRQEPGITARRVFFRSQVSAEKFADAIASLRREASLR